MIIFTITIKRWLLVFLSFLVGLMLMFLPLTRGLYWLNSLWLVLILWYWVLIMPQHVGVGIAWWLGIIIDIIYNVTLGMHALVLVLISYFILKTRDKILPLGFLRITPIIFGLLALYLALIFFMQSYIGNYFNAWSVLGGAIIGALVWAPLAWLLFNLQQKFHI